MDEILIRGLLALAIIAGGLGLYLLTNRLILARAAGASAKNALPNGARSGVPAVLYFTTPQCAPCKTVQRPALRQLQERLGERLQVIEVDAQAQPEIAGAWGVLSVPTTFVIDAQGSVRHVNHGATRAEKLLEQLQGLEGDGI